MSRSEKIQKNIVTNVCTSSCKVPVILVRFKLNVPADFQKILLKYKVLWKSIQWEQNYSMQVDIQTWRL